MNEGEFTKKHPSLTGKVCWGDFQEKTPVGMLVGKTIGFIKVEDVHETQIDKEKVRKVVDDCVEPPFNDKLKKELGLI